MITITVELSWKKQKETIVVKTGSTIEALLIKLELIEKENNFFYIINGLNKMKSYTLKDGDYVKIFLAMSGG